MRNCYKLIDIYVHTYIFYWRVPRGFSESFLIILSQHFNQHFTNLIRNLNIFYFNSLIIIFILIFFNDFNNFYFNNLICYYFSGSRLLYVYERKEIEIYVRTYIIYWLVTTELFRVLFNNFKSAF